MPIKVCEEITYPTPNFNGYKQDLINFYTSSMKTYYFYASIWDKKNVSLSPVNIHTIVKVNVNHSLRHGLYDKLEYFIRS